MLRASHMNAAGMERPPRNSTPIKLLSNQRRRLKKKSLELQFALTLEDSLPGDRKSNSEVDSILFHHRDDGSTWDDLSKYAYSEAGDLLKDDSNKSDECKQASHAMVASSSAEEADLPTAEAQALDDSKSLLSYLEDSAPPHLQHHPQQDSGTSQQLHLHASLQSVTSAVMEASKECTTVIHSVQESEDLNLISLAGISQDDIMSAMDAEDSLNLQKEKEIRQQEQQQQQQQLQVHKGISNQSHSTPSVNPQQSQGTTSVVNSSSRESSDLTSSRENSRATSDLTLARDMNVRQDPPDDKKMEIVFDPNDQEDFSAVDGMGFEVHLTDLEKSILAGQARAMAAEIDSPLHNPKRNRSKRSSASEIPPVLQEVYVPSHKRHSSTNNSSRSRRSKRPQYDYSKTSNTEDEQKPPKHSSLSPFVLKQCYGDGQDLQQRSASAIATSVEDHESACGSRDALKTIYSRDSEGVESADHSSSAATQNAQRSAKRHTTGSKAGSCSRRSGATSTLATNSRSGRSHARSRDSSTRKSAASSRRRAAAAARLSQSERCLSISNRQDSSRLSMSEHRRRSHSETRGSSHAVPKQPGLNYNSDNDAASQRRRRARSMSRSRRRERSLSIQRTLKRVKSAGCLMCSNRDSQKSLAKEETERGDKEPGMLDQTERMTERDQTSAYGEYKDQVYEDIHYVMDESEDEDDEDDFEAEEDEDDNKTRRSRMSRTARSIKRNISRKLSGTLSLRKFRQQPQDDEDPEDDNSSQGRSRATRSSRRSRSTRGKQRVSLRSFMQQQEDQDSDQEEQDNYSRARTTTSGVSRSRSARLSLRKFLQQSENRNQDDEGRTAVTSAVTSSVPSEPTNTGSTPKRSQSRRKQFAQSISRSIRASFRSTLRRTKRVRKERRKRNAANDEPEQDDNEQHHDMPDSRVSKQQQDIHIGGRSEEEDVDHERDIVFDPGHASDESEKENSVPAEGSVSAIEIDVDEIDVDALQRIREQQEKQQNLICSCPGKDIMLRSCPIHGVWADAILQHVQKQPQQQQEEEEEDSTTRQRPNLAMTRSAVDFTSQDFTVVHNNHKHESFRSFRSGSSGSSQGGGSTRTLGVKKQRSFRSLWTDSKTKRAGAGERPKGPPNTRYTNQHRMASWLKSHSDHSTPTRCNSRRQMLLQTRGRSARTRDSDGSSTSSRSQRRARSMEDVDRRGSF